jgi:vacuolar-type H+-ATPase subunit I/STV1
MVGAHMASPWDEVRRESLEMPAVGYHRRGSPLPWLLLGVSITLTMTVLVVGRNRLMEEKERTWTSLKANDELNQKLKATQKELEKSKETCSAGDEASGDQTRRIVQLEMQNRRLQDELTRAKKK